MVQNQEKPATETSNRAIEQRPDRIIELLEYIPPPDSQKMALTSQQVFQAHAKTD